MIETKEEGRKEALMAAMTTTASTLQLQHLQNLSSYKCLSLTSSSSSSSNRISFFQSHFTRNKQLLVSSNANLRVLKDVGVKPISAVGSGMEASIAETSEKLIALKNVKIVIESQEEDKMQVRVDLSGDETQKVFNKALTNLARSAPPIPGFRREKGGKTTKVPTEFLLQILGEDRVTNFVIQEIVTSTMADYENLKVKEDKITTTQKAEELKKVFVPGNEFGFNAVLELEKPEAETESENEEDEAETENESEPEPSS
uniref:peptidylprolyl isomerase n=2 Tax=Salix viminalis TaxID=40686 RepID=A0A6N2M7Y4_SALVM